MLQSVDFEAVQPKQLRQARDSRLVSIRVGARPRAFRQPESDLLSAIGAERFHAEINDDGSRVTCRARHNHVRSGETPMLQASSVDSGNGVLHVADNP